MRIGQKLSSLVAPIFVLFLSLFFLHSSARGAPNNAKAPAFFWAFGALRTTSTHPTALPVTSGMVLHSGDKLKMMLRIRKKCFVYVLYKDSQGNLSMLFPYSPKFFESDYRIDHNYYVPESDAWFQLDTKTGKETFYLIASEQRLRDIEYTYKKYVSCKGEKNKRDLAGQMLSELDSISRQNLALANRAGEPGGEKTLVRGFERAAGEDPTDITGLAKAISFNNIYSQTFVIVHK
ncbi:MAG: DUF4384 domain-containing protein [Syntrophobacteraceae bacterium]